MNETPTDTVTELPRIDLDFTGHPDMHTPGHTGDQLHAVASLLEGELHANDGCSVPTSYVYSLTVQPLPDPPDNRWQVTLITAIGTAVPLPGGACTSQTAAEDLRRLALSAIRQWRSRAGLSVLGPQETYRP